MKLFNALFTKHTYSGRLNLEIAINRFSIFHKKRIFTSQFSGHCAVQCFLVILYRLYSDHPGGHVVVERQAVDKTDDGPFVPAGSDCGGCLVNSPALVVV